MPYSVASPLDNKHKSSSNTLRAHVPLIALLTLSAILHFWNVSHLEVQSDLAINSVRAFGWWDYLSEDGQTSPDVWFGSVPWWGNLSFHDHPPLAFLFSHLSFRALGANALGAHAPYLVANLLTMLCVYFFVARLRSSREALLAALFFSVSSFALWGARSGYLEAIATLFITLSFGLFCLFLTTLNNKFLLAFAAASALGLLTKYTTIVMLLSSAALLLIWNPVTIAKRTFMQYGGLLILLLTPIIIYNAAVFLTRGHFDASLSSILGIPSQDFPIIAGRHASVSLANIASPFTILSTNTSLAFSALLILSLLFLLFEVARTRKKTAQEMHYPRLLGVTLALSILLLMVLPAARFATIIMPFLSMAAAYAVVRALASIGARKFKKIIITASIGVIVAAELLYAINSNLLVRPFGLPGIHYAKDRQFDHGLEALNKNLIETIFKDLPEAPPARQKKVASREGTLVIIDDRLNWFLLMWYFKRYSFYFDAPLVGYSDVIKILQKENIPLTIENVFAYLAGKDIANVWFISTVDTRLREGADDPIKKSADDFEQVLLDSGYDPVRYHMYDGSESIRLYAFSF